MMYPKFNAASSGRVKRGPAHGHFVGDAGWPGYMALLWKNTEQNLN